MEYNLVVNQEKKSIDAAISDQNIEFEINNRIYDTKFVNISDHQILLNVNGLNINAFILNDKDRKTIIIKGRSYEVIDADLAEQSSTGDNNSINSASIVASPIPAVVIKVLITTGDRVKKGQGLIIVSAMKMETTLFAPFDGIVSKINTKEGDKVIPVDILVDIEKDGDIT